MDDLVIKITKIKLDFAKANLRKLAKYAAEKIPKEIVEFILSNQDDLRRIVKVVVEKRSIEVGKFIMSKYPEIGMKFASETLGKLFSDSSQTSEKEGIGSFEEKTPGKEKLESEKKEKEILGNRASPRKRKFDDTTPQPEATSPYLPMDGVKTRKRKRNDDSLEN